MAKFFLMAASLRKDSVNKKLIQQTAKYLKTQNNQVDLADFAEFEVPLYNQDIQDRSGVPREVQNFIDRIHDASGIVIASPEYNYSIPGTLKNLIDWVSRATPMPWKGKKILLLSASPGLVGGNRGLWAARIPLEGCGAFVYPQMFSLPNAYDSFDGEGNFTDPKNKERLADLLSYFSKWV